MDTYSLENTAKKYTQYDMIQLNTDLPKFPNLRSELLFTVLKRDSLPVGLGELYALVASLAQLGLDTHEMIPATNDRKEKKEARSRQLKVLAGDYFSGRFYYLLSQAGQVDMVRQMSEAICDVNRIKMNLYNKMLQWKVTAEDYLHLTVNIKTQLYESFSRQLEGSLSNSWPELLKGYTKCEILLDEIKRIDHAGSFRSSWAFWHIMQTGTKEERRQLQQQEEPDQTKLRTLILKYNVKSQLFQMLESQFKVVTESIRVLESDKLIQELFRLGEPFTRYLTAPRAIEEG